MRRLMISLVAALVLSWSGASAQIAPGVPPPLDGNPTFVVGSEDSPGANDIRVTVSTTTVTNNMYRVWISTAGACQLVTTDAVVTPVSGGVLMDTHTANGHLVFLIAGGPFVVNLNISGAVTRYLNLEYQGRCVSQAVTWTA